MFLDIYNVHTALTLGFLWVCPLDNVQSELNGLIQELGSYKTYITILVIYVYGDTGGDSLLNDIHIQIDRGFLGKWLL